MGERNIERKREQESHAPKELSFDQVLDSMSPSEIRARMRAVGKELSAEGKLHPKIEEGGSRKSIDFGESSQAKDIYFSQSSQGKSIDFSQSAKTSHRSTASESFQTSAEVKQFSEQQPIKMTYDKESKTYVTDDGYILNGGANAEIVTGLMLQESLNKVAQVQESEAKLPSARPAQLGRLTNLDDSLVSLPYSNGGLDYRGLAGSLPVGQLYGPGSSSCSELSINADASIVGLGGVGMTIYDQQNDECRLAQTVKQACATAELLSTDVANSRTVNEMMAKSDAVVVASEYCSATLDAVEEEKKRLKSEDDD